MQSQSRSPAGLGFNKMAVRIRIEYTPGCTALKTILTFNKCIGI